MTGTGTQADPYIVSTLGELITAVGGGNDGAYVKLANDIDVSADETYKNGVNSTINAYCLGLDGDGHTISGLISKKGTAINFARAGLIKNLTIKNMMNICDSYKQALIKCTAANGAYATFQNVVISARTDCAQKDVGSFCDGGNWNNCAITFMPINPLGAYPSGNDVVFAFTSASECAIRYDAINANRGARYGIQLVTNASNSYIFGDVSLSDDRSTTLFSYCTKCASYINFSVESNKQIVNAGGSSNIVVTDTSTGVTITPGTGHFGITSAQAKDESYLSSIGFLP